MRKKFFLIVACLVLSLSITACKKKEEQPVPQTPGPMMPGQMPSQMPGQMPPGQLPSGQMPPAQMPPMGQQQGMQPGMMKMGKTEVVVPNSVKGKWSAAKLIVEDKATRTKHEYTVKLNSDFKIPDTDLRIHAGEFLPDFRMEGLRLTSGSNEARNPALAIRVFEKGKQIFPAPGRQWGWLFGKVPSIHPFEHQRYAITLKEGIKAG